MRRNLLYFLYPLKGSIWTWNVEQLRPFLPSFNGRKIVCLAESGGTESLETVASSFGDPAVEFLRFQNDPERGEQVGFRPGLERLESRDPQEITFYGHGKGVSHWEPSVVTMMLWARAMYLLNLSHMDVIERIMAGHAAAGAFRMRRHWPGPGNWFYSGAFFWLKHSETFSRDWWNVFYGRCGPEDYPGAHFKWEETFDLTLGAYSCNMYHRALSEEEINGLLARLKEAVPSVPEGDPR